MSVTKRTVLEWGPPSAEEAQEALDRLVMAWATDTDTGQARYIMELGPERNGNKCRCQCPSCGHPLRATNAGKTEGTYVQRPHFKHQAGVQRDDCLILSARAAALRLLLEEGVLELPGRSVTREVHGLSGAAYLGEASGPALREPIRDFRYVDRTRALIELDDGRRVMVALTGTNQSSEGARPDSNDLYAVVYITINDPELAKLQPEELRARLRLLPELFGYLHHRDDPRLQEQAQAQAQTLAQEHLDWVRELDPELAAVPPELRRETLLHLTVKRLLAEAGCVRVPELEVTARQGTGFGADSLVEVLVESQKLQLNNVRLEHRIAGVIPDVLADATAATGEPFGILGIEVTVTHGVDAIRQARLRDAGHATLEVDLSRWSGRLRIEDLKRAVVEELEGKRWVHHPDISSAEDRLHDSLRRRREAHQSTLIPPAAPRTDGILMGTLTPSQRSNVGRGGRRELGIDEDGARPRQDELSSRHERWILCKRLASHRKESGQWSPDDNLLDGLVSLYCGEGVGCHQGLSAMKVAFKLNCTVDSELQSLVLIVARHTNPARTPQELEKLNDWAARVRAKVRARDPAWLPPKEALYFLEEVFPGVEKAVLRMLTALDEPRLNR